MLCPIRVGMKKNNNRFLKNQLQNNKNKTNKIILIAIRIIINKILILIIVIITSLINILIITIILLKIMINIIQYKLKGSYQEYNELNIVSYNKLKYYDNSEMNLHSYELYLKLL